METFKVRRWPEQGSTLHSISEMFYGDATLWYKIYHANKDKFPLGVLKAGEVVRVPTLPLYEEMMVLYEEA